MSKKAEATLILCSCMLVVAFYWKLYIPLLPAKGPAIGADYSLFLPNLLAGYYWFLVNGYAALPWFTPSQCGGFPFFADPNAAYLSVPQFLSFAMQPLQAVQATFFLFAVLGFLGEYHLLRYSFRCSIVASLLGGGLFAFNGMYAHRVLAGHLTFHSFMLQPIAAAFLMPGSTPFPRWPAAVARFSGAGLCFAYMFSSGMVNLLIPVFLSCLALMFVQSAVAGWRLFPWICFLAAIGIAAGLSANQLEASAALLRQLPRNQYLLPGIPSLWTLIGTVFDVLFIGPPGDAEIRAANASFALLRHEWEYSVSCVPLILMVAVSARVAWLGARRYEPSLATGAAVACLLLVVAIPIAANFYEPAWNHLLKKIPIISSSSNLLRWFSTYIPMAIALGVLALDSLLRTCGFSGLSRALIGSFLMIVALCQHGLSGDLFYRAQDQYNPAPIDTAWIRASRTRRVVPIVSLGIYTDRGGRIQFPINRNDVFVQGSSNLGCYQPLLGYNLERFSIGNLRIGPVTLLTGRSLNIRNPTCYLYPGVNECRPDGSFTVEQLAKAQAFTSYRPFIFTRPLIGQLAVALTKATMYLVLVSLFASLVAVLGRGRVTLVQLPIGVGGQADPDRDTSA